MEPNLPYTPRMRYSDESIHLTFKYPTIQPGEVISFEYAHICVNGEAEEAMAYLGSINIIQPTDILSGPNSLIVVSLDNKLNSWDFSFVNCTFSLYSNLKNAIGSSLQWHVLGSNLTAVNDFNSTSRLYTFMFNSTLYEDGVSQVKVTCRSTRNEFTKEKIIDIANNGIHMCFNTFSNQDINGTNLFLTNQFYSLSLQYCSNTGKSLSELKIVSVSYYFETSINDEQLSKYISTETLFPFVVEFSSSFLSLPSYSSFHIKAVVLSQTINGSAQLSTVTIFAGLLTPSLHSTNINLSNDKLKCKYNLIRWKSKILELWNLYIYQPN